MLAKLGAVFLAKQGAVPILAKLGAVFLAKLGAVPMLSREPSRVSRPGIQYPRILRLFSRILLSLPYTFF